MSRINRWLKFCPAKQITGQKKSVCEATDGLPFNSEGYERA